MVVATAAAEIVTTAMAAAVVAETDLLLTVSSMTMHHAAEAYPLERRHPPIDLPPVRLSIFRSAISGEEEGVRWFLNQVNEACQGLERGSEHLDEASEM